jgi:serine protease Do
MKSSLKIIAVACSVWALFLMVPSEGLSQRTVPKAQDQVMLSFAPLVKQASPAVVNIFTRKAVQQRGPSSPLFNDPFFRRFFGERLKIHSGPGLLSGQMG